MLALLCASLSMGCQAPGVGDPCEPEKVPEGGFQASETYLETSSVQCRTRVCMVYRLAGDPTPDCVGATCADPMEVGKRIYCSCRCAAPAGSKVPTCECPDDYSCQPVFENGGEGLRGSYCVRNGT